MGYNITNYTMKGTRRVDMVFSIGYEDDIDKARNVILDIIRQDHRVLKEPASLVAVSELADSSVNFVVRAWTLTKDYSSVYFDTLETVKKRFDLEGISIPFP
jgi:small conductance mechanosensitive channel